ncbi:MAG: hypothetical protein WCP97_09105 [bacterium]
MILTRKPTSKWQVTLPPEVRHALQLTQGEKIAFSINDDGTVELQPVTTTLESIYGSVKPLQSPKDFNQIIQAVAEDKAEKYRTISKPTAEKHKKNENSK